MRRRRLAGLSILALLALVAVNAKAPAQAPTRSRPPAPAFISAEVVGVDCPVPGLANEVWGYPDSRDTPFRALYTLKVLQWHVGSGPSEIEVVYRQGLAVHRGRVVAVSYSNTVGPIALPRGTRLVGSLQFNLPMRHNDGVPERVLSWAELDDVELLIEVADGRFRIAQRTHACWTAPPDSVPAAEVDLAQLANEAYFGPLIPTDRTPESAVADWKERLRRQRALRRQ